MRLQNKSTSPSVATKILHLKETLQRKTDERNVAQANANLILKQIQKKFPEVTSIEEARELLASLEKKVSKQKARFDEAYSTFMETYGDYL